ncbi:MAG: TolB family protein, partial [Gemmatimonadaceae bacterium]
MLVRATGRGDGALRNDLFIWDFRSNVMRRVTHAGGLRHADPSPDGEHAVADRCVAGICDVVLVDLRSGRLHTIARGSPRLVYFRPMYSRDGQRIVVNVQEHGRWRPALLGPNTSAQRQRLIGPADGANRYDAVFSADGRSVIVVSDASGIPNIERLDSATGTAVPLTHVTGAALAPAPDWVHGSIYFLRLHARGLDLAMTPDTAIHVAPAEAGANLEPAARVPLAPGDSFTARPVSPDTPYGLGPRRYRVLPSISIAAEGKTFGLTLASTDPIGRFTWLAQGAYGDRGSWRGGSLSGEWRGSVPSLGAQVFYAEDQVSTQHGGIASSGVPDVDYLGVLATATVDQDLLTNVRRFRVGASVGRLNNRHDSSSARLVGFVVYSAAAVQTSKEWRFLERLGLRGDLGRTAGRSWARTSGSTELTLSHGSLAVEGDAAFGVVNSDADPV